MTARRLAAAALAAALAAVLAAAPTPPASPAQAATPALPALGLDADNPTLLARMLDDIGRSTITANTSYMTQAADLDTAELGYETTRGVTLHIVSLGIDADLRHIAAGVYDRDLRRIAAQIQAWRVRHPGHRLVLRPLWEGNGPTDPANAWAVWQTGVNGTTAADYRRAWRHVRAVMRGRAPGLRFFWCPNILYSRWASYAAIYPGQDQVEYVGVDGYNRAEAAADPYAWKTPSQVLDASLRAVRAVDPFHPLIVGETGTSEPQWGARSRGHSKAEWFGQLGVWLRTTAPAFRVSVVSYFDYDKRSRNGNDWRVYPAGRPYAVQSRDAFRAALRGIR